MDKYKQKLIHALSDINTDGEVVRWIERNFPELRESEEETTRKELLDFVRSFWADHKEKLPQASRWVTYLEKLKENPKSTDSIPSDCVSDAKCENRWHKVQDSLPDNGRLVLAQDCLGNTLLARYDGEGNWEVSVYDNEDYYCWSTITKWCEIPSEKQKEQRPENILTDDDSLQTAYLKGQTDVLEDPEAYGLQKEQKPAEWSEEDEKMRKNLIELLIRLSANTRTDSTSPNYSYPREIDWLKSLRPTTKE